MTHRFLIAKHWLIFMFILVLPILIHFFSMLVFFEQNIDAMMTNSPPKIDFFLIPFTLVMFIQVFGTFGWMWSVSVGLHKKLPSDLRMNIRQFKFFLLFPAVYLSVFIVLFFMLFMKLEENFSNPNPAQMFGNFFALFAGVIIMLPLHFLAIFCMFYCYQFSAKTLKSIELGRRATTEEYIGEFFMFWFNFIGVWIMQPRITNIYLNYPDIEQQIILPENGDFRQVEFQKDADRTRVDRIRGRDHDTFRHDDDFDGII